MAPWWEMTFRSEKDSHRRAQARKCPLRLAIVAVTVSAFAGAPLIFWYIAPGAAIVVGVVNLLACGFFGFVDGIVRTNSSHVLGLL
jgi:hypothetical protein